MDKSLLVSVALLLAMFAVSFYYLPLLPEKIATHWNAAGIADGFSDKTFGLFIIPIIVLVCFLVFLAIPKIDPLKQNILKASTEYYGFILVFMIFFTIIHSFTILFNLGQNFDIRLFIIPGFALLIGYLGFLLPRVKRNYSIGIRTAWTLASDTVWEKTHKIGGKLFMACAILSLFSIIFPDLFIYFLIVPLITVTVFLFGYSYLEFTKEEKQKAHKK